VVVGLAGVATLLALWGLSGNDAGARASSGQVSSSWVRHEEVVIADEHDTLWSIATRTRPGVDPRITVQRIIDINGLDGVIIQPGQRLVLPPK
jgi:LysM repeat protein